MTIEKLNALLEAGSITQDEYDELAKNVKDPEPATDPTPTPDPEPKAEPIDAAYVDRLVQAKVDRMLAAERKEKADLKRQLENEKKAKLSEAELKQYEIDEREKTIAAREKELQDRLNREFAQKALREAGLDDGSQTAYALADFVMGEDEEEIKGKVKTFKELFDKAVAAEVNKRFKENGRTPKKGTDTNGGVNPFKKETFNFTEQLKLMNTNPELAARLKAEAGIV